MQLTRGVWQMSLAMIISGSIWRVRAALWFAGDGCGVLALPDWRANLLVFIVLRRPALQPANAFHSRSGSNWRRGAGRQLAAAVCRLFADLNRYGHRGHLNTQPFMLVMMGMVLGERVSAVKWDGYCWPLAA